MADETKRPNGQTSVAHRGEGHGQEEHEARMADRLGEAPKKTRRGKASGDDSTES